MILMSQETCMNINYVRKVENDTRRRLSMFDCQQVGSLLVSPFGSLDPTRIASVGHK